MMLLPLFIGCTLLATVVAVPVQKSSTDVLKLAKEYAARHPNTETTKNEEFGDLLEGDITVNNDDEINPLSDYEMNPLNAVTDPRLVWPNRTLYYVIENGAYTPEEVDLIEAGIEDLQFLTKVGDKWCVRIIPRETEPNYVSVENYSGCSSYLGMIGGKQRLSLVPSCIYNRHGTVMHEFLHAFGFHHEQKRTDRDDYIIVNWDNIQPGTENNFVKLTPNLIDLLETDYDYGSVMHYSAYGFAIDPEIPTIITLDPDAEIGQRLTLSQLDIERVQIYYGCIAPADSVHFKHLDKSTLFKAATKP